MLMCSSGGRSTTAALTWSITTPGPLSKSLDWLEPLHQHLVVQSSIFPSLPPAICPRLIFGNAHQSFRGDSRQPRGRARCFDNGERARRPPRRREGGPRTREEERTYERASERRLFGRRVAEDEDGEAKEIFGNSFTPTDLVEGQAGRDGGREQAASGQAPARGVREDPRPPRRERPLPSGSELQVLSSEAGGAGGADEAGRA